MIFRVLLMVCAVAVFPNLAFAQSIEILAAPDLNLSAPDFSDPSIFSADPPIAIVDDVSAADVSADPALSLTAAEQALLDLTNADRAAAGLVQLQFDPALLSIARARAQAQVGSPTLNHYDATGGLAFVGLLSQAGIQYRLAGENLARVSGSGVNAAQQAEPALMASPTHRANILEPTFRVAAMGLATDSNGRTVFAEIYRTA